MKNQIISLAAVTACLLSPVAVSADTTTFEKKGVCNYATEAVSTVEGDNTLAVVDDNSNDVLFGCLLIDDTYHIIANSGLYVREAPSVESKSIVCLPYGSNITVKGGDFHIIVKHRCVHCNKYKDNYNNCRYEGFLEDY